MPRRKQEITEKENESLHREKRSLSGLGCGKKRLGGFKKKKKKYSRKKKKKESRIPRRGSKLIEGDWGSCKCIAGGKRIAEKKKGVS